MSNSDVQVGVIGVGSMGKHHTRVYEELPEADLVGVHDADRERAEEIASKFGTRALSLEELLSQVDAVSIVAPTSHHYNLAKHSLDAEVAVLVEKPFVAERATGEELIKLARDRNLLLQVGHIEQYNPAVQTLKNLIPQLDVVAIEARRLGPDPGREIQDSVVTDLMIHDIDIVRSIVDDDIGSIHAAGDATGRYATATLQFQDGTIASLTASRRTQQKIRELTLTADDRFVTLDYLNQSLEIHRQTTPEYIAEDGSVRFRTQSVVERPLVENVEPLKNELRSFVEAYKSSSEPLVSGADALKVLDIVEEVETKAFPSNQE